MQCPPIDPQMLRYLDYAFPDRASDPAAPNAQEKFGSVKVVRHLKAVLQEQELHL